MKNELIIPNLNLAREITNKFLKDEQPYLDENAFYMFSISKFILLKEKVIKKDSENNILYFNNIKYKKYIPIILEFYKQILKNGKYKKNNVSIEYEDEKTRTDELDNAIWCFNKIRDCLAHGHYIFDFTKKCIIINNEQIDKNFVLKCELPIELLNSFTYIFEDYDNSEFLEPNIYIKMDNKTYKNENKITKENILLNHTYTNKYTSKNNYDIFKNINIDDLSIKKLSALANLLIMIEPKTSKERKEIITLLKKYKSLLELYNPKKTEKDFYYKTKKLIKEMKKIIGIDDKCINPNGIISLYNYISLVFAQQKEIDYSKINLHRIFTKFYEKDNKKGIANNNEDLIESIKRNVIKFNLNMKNHIQNYQTNPNQRFRHTLIDSFSKFYTEILDIIGEKNKLIIKSIRNGVEHGNYSYCENEIVIYDKKNQHDDNTIKFIAMVSPKELFNISKQIELGNENKYSIKDFIQQLSSIIGNELFEEFWNNINQISNIIFGKNLNINYTMEDMYREAIATILLTISKK